MAIPNITKGDIVICGFQEIPEICRKHGIEHAISIRDPSKPTPEEVIGLDHLRLHFSDTIDPEDPACPDIGSIRMLMARGIGLLHAAKRAQKPLLVHCEGGIARSTASALILFSEALGHSQANAEMAMDWILETREEADPNIMMCELADQILGTSHLTAAVDGAEDEIVRRFVKRHELELVDFQEA